MQIKRKIHPAVEMQMGPMIDMVFLLLVFFMVTAKPIKQESDINIGLPGIVAQDEALDIPDEQRILIRSDGQVLLNELPMDSPTNEVLPSLISTLKRFKATADANRSEALVTIDAEDGSTHQRIVNVLNACAIAEITGVTFADTTGEDI
jgi:biopolymer transport protein ExbD